MQKRKLIQMNESIRVPPWPNPDFTKLKTLRQHDLPKIEKNSPLEQRYSQLTQEFTQFCSLKNLMSYSNIYKRLFLLGHIYRLPEAYFFQLNANNILHKNLTFFS